MSESLARETRKRIAAIIRETLPIPEPDELEHRNEIDWNLRGNDDDEGVIGMKKPPAAWIPGWKLDDPPDESITIGEPKTPPMTEAMIQELFEKARTEADLAAAEKELHRLRGTTPPERKGI